MYVGGLSISNSTVAGNTASEGAGNARSDGARGGGIACGGGTVTDCKFVGNSVHSETSGVGRWRIDAMASRSAAARSRATPRFAPARNRMIPKARGRDLGRHRLALGLPPVRQLRDRLGWRCFGASPDDREHHIIGQYRGPGGWCDLLRRRKLDRHELHLVRQLRDRRQRGGIGGIQCRNDAHAHQQHDLRQPWRRGDQGRVFCRSRRPMQNTIVAGNCRRERQPQRPEI